MLKNAPLDNAPNSSSYSYTTEIEVAWLVLPVSSTVSRENGTRLTEESIHGKSFAVQTVLHQAYSPGRAAGGVCAAVASKGTKTICIPKVVTRLASEAHHGGSSLREQSRNGALTRNM